MGSSGHGAAGAPLPSFPTEPSNFTKPATLPPRPSITLPAQPPKAGRATTDSSTGGADFATDSGRGAANSTASQHLTLIAVLAVFVTVAALGLLWFFLHLIRRQKQQIRLLGDSTAPPPPTAGHCEAGGIVALGRRWSKNTGSSLAHSPINPLRLWLRDPTAFRRFRYSEIRKATDDFSSVIGKGGFGTVYKARFDGGTVAAVKRMMGRISRQRDKEFCKEMEFLGRLHHRHLLTLMGFCITRTERFLVYEFMENGSLSEHLRRGDHKSPPLAWQTRIQIAIDVAAALEYLHFFSDPPLCHRDIKSSNILLDKRFMAKVADFGLALPTPTMAPCGGGASVNEMSTNVRGTPGYLDPEYVVTQQLTAKSDIYSYGVVLLELVTGREAVQDKCNLVAWAEPYLWCAEQNHSEDLEHKLLAMADPALLPQLTSQKHLAGQLRNMARLIRMCTAKDSHSRPTIRQVLAFLYTRFDSLNPNSNLIASCPSPNNYLHKPNPNPNCDIRTSPNPYSVHVSSTMLCAGFTTF